MMEAALVVVTLAQSGLIWYLLKIQREERAKLINSLVAKDPREMIELEALDKVKPEKKPRHEDTLTPIDQLSDDDFKKYVLES